MSEFSHSNRASLRKLISIILPTASDLEAFCLDFFPDVAARFASGQNRVDRDNLLLQLTDEELLVEALQKCNPRRFARARRLCRPLQGPSSTAPQNPYRGLSAFQIEESDLFFGRDELTERLWQRFRILYDRIGATRVLAILGPSGSGKSSVARAGLLAELVTSPIPGPQAVPPVVLKPGSHPLTALAIALGPPAGLLPTPSELSGQRDLADFLRQPSGNGELDGLSQWAANRLSASSSPVVVLVDQFEEVYTLCTDTRERDAFIGVLLHAAANRMRHVSVILTLSSDFLGETHRQHPELNRIIGEQSIIVTAMSREELSQVIAEPAARAGQPLDDATVQLLLTQSWGREGTLPLLEFALMRIWDGMQARKEPAETLRAIGGIGGAVAGKAQEIYDMLDAPEQATARRALVRLVQLGLGTRDTRRRAPISELCGRGELENSVLSVLRKFATENARLVTLSGQGEETLAEVTHEALFDEWSALRMWIEQSRQDRGLHDRAIEAAKLWAQNNQPEGRLFRPPDLDLLRDYQRRKPEEFGVLLSSFLQAAERHQKHEKELVIGVIGGALLTLLVIGWIYVSNGQYRREVTRGILLESYVDRGSQLLFERGRSNEALLWLHRAQGGGSKDPALLDMLKTAMQSVDATEFVLIGHSSSVRSATFSPDGHHIITKSADGLLRVWDAEGGRLLSERKSGLVVGELSGQLSAVRNAAFSPDGRRVVKVSDDSIARIWDVQSGQLVAELIGHGKSINTVEFSPDGRRIVTASADQTARVWRADDMRLLTEFKTHEGRIASVGFGTDGRRMVALTNGDKVSIWDATKDQLLVELPRCERQIFSTVFDRDGQLIVMTDDEIQVFKAEDGRLLAKRKRHGTRVYGAALSRDGRRIVTVDFDQVARVWELESGRLLAELRGHAEKITEAVFSPDGRYIATASLDRTARLWKADSGQLAVEYKGHEGSVNSVAFSPHGVELITASSDGTARVWSANTGWLSRILQGHRASVTMAAFSPDGRLILTASGDYTVRVWADEGGKLLAELRGHTGGITSAAFNLEGNRILTASDDRTARLWDLSIETRSHEQLAKLIRCRVPAQFEREGSNIIVFRMPTPAECQNTATSYPSILSSPEKTAY